MISDYAAGRLGWVMTTAFVALSADCLTLGLGMVLAGPRSLPGRAAALGRDAWSADDCDVSHRLGDGGHDDDRRYPHR